MSEINELAIKKEFDEANNRLNNLERTLRRDGLLNAEKEAQIRDKRKSLFDFGQSNSDDFTKNNASGELNERTRITGFSTDDKPKQKPDEHEKPKVNPNDFDWDVVTPQKKKQSASLPQEIPQRKKTKTEDDFFNSVGGDKSQAKASSSKPADKITNDDFNF